MSLLERGSPRTIFVLVLKQAVSIPQHRRPDVSNSPERWLLAKRPQEYKGVLMGLPKQVFHHEEVLSSLPPEIHAVIAPLLDPPTCTSIRQTCWTIYQYQIYRQWEMLHLEMQTRDAVMEFEKMFPCAPYRSPPQWVITRWDATVAKLEVQQACATWAMYPRKLRLTCLDCVQMKRLDDFPTTCFRPQRREELAEPHFSCHHPHCCCLASSRLGRSRKFNHPNAASHVRGVAVTVNHKGIWALRLFPAAQWGGG